MGNPPRSDRSLTWALGSPAEEMLPGEEESLAELAKALQEGAAQQDSCWPEPAPGETDRLVAALSALVDGPKTTFAAELTQVWTRRQGWLTGTLAAVQPQVRVLARPFWLSSAALVAIGLPLLSPQLLASFSLDLSYGAFLLLIAPLLAALGVAYAFRETGTGVAEVELTCAITPAQLVLGRLFWVTAYDALLLSAASLLSSSLEPGIQLGLLVLGWLTPMLLLSLGVLALSLYVPLWIGTGTALALWALVLGVLLRGRGLPMAALTDETVLLPIAVVGAVGALLIVGLTAAAWPRLTARMTGLEYRG